VSLTVNEPYRLQTLESAFNTCASLQSICIPSSIKGLSHLTVESGCQLKILVGHPFAAGSQSIRWDSRESICHPTARLRQVAGFGMAGSRTRVVSVHDGISFQVHYWFAQNFSVVVSDDHDTCQTESHSIPLHFTRRFAGTLRAYPMN
jgi:hypothetical protein